MLVLLMAFVELVDGKRRRKCRETHTYINLFTSYLHKKTLPHLSQPTIATLMYSHM